MKKILFLAMLFSFLFSANIFSQLKIGYVDSESIMKNLPDAQDAQQKIDAQIDEWQKELTTLQNDWKKKYEDYERRKLIMSNQKKAEVEKELVTLEEKVDQFRNSKFGANGELFKKQEELMKPIHNQIFNVIQEIAKQDGYDFVFDRSGDLIFLYAKEEHDLTNKVLSKLQ